MKASDEGAAFVLRDRDLFRAAVSFTAQVLAADKAAPAQ
jgi:hypothetical protein